MKILEDKIGNITLLSVEGNLNTINAPIAEKTMRGIIDTGEKNLIINFSKLRYISSAGLRIILVTAKDIKSKNGKLVLCSMSDSIKKDFDITGFSSRFDIQDSVKAAIERF